MRRSMLCPHATQWCGVTEELRFRFEVAGRGLRDDFAQQQWWWSSWPVECRVTTRLPLLFTNVAACRQDVQWVCRRSSGSICNQEK